MMTYTNNDIVNLIASFNAVAPHVVRIINALSSMNMETLSTLSQHSQMPEVIDALIDVRDALSAMMP